MSIAQTTINGLTADANVTKNTSTGTLAVSGVTSTYLQVGNSGTADEDVVYVFQIPAAVLSDASQEFSTASFKATLGSNAMPAGTNGDLYGLGYRTSSTVLTTDFYKGTLDPNATLVMDNFLTSSDSAYGNVTTSATALTSYLNAQLSAARNDGATSAYVFLRISPDATSVGNHAIIAMADLGGSAVPTLTYTTVATGFRNVLVGGGGAVLGVYADPHVSGLFYMRTDVGGAYRWDSVNSVWIPITESFSVEDFGIDSLAVDPSTGSTVYVQTGKYTYDASHIYKSTNAGSTWTTLAAPSGMVGGSNDTNKQVGEHIQVDPNNSSVLFLATRNVGLWKSTNGGTSWTQVTVYPGGAAFPYGDSANERGQSFVAFDKGGGTTGGASSIIYVGVYDTTTGTTDGGVWVTTNGGANWTQMTGSATTPQRAMVSSDGTLYATFYGSTSGSVRKAARGNTAMTDISPATGTSFAAVAVNPANALEVLVSPHQSGANANTYRSTNGGGTWTITGRVHGSGNVVTRDSTGWFEEPFSLVYNPFSTTEVWMSDLIGVLRTPDITNNTVPWDYLYKGDEEIVPLVLVGAPTGAPLLSGDADVNGARHTDVAAYPVKGFTTSSSPSSYGSTTGMDFCEADPTVWARVLDIFTATPTGYYSTDDGQSWTGFASIPSGATGGRIAVSATNSSNFVWIPEDGTVYYTTDRGAHWATAVGAPNASTSEFGQQGQPLASDRVAGGTFYLFKDVKGSPNGYAQIYRSTDGGQTWAAVGTCPYTGNHADAYQYKVLTAPGVSGEVWVDLGYIAVYKSTNSGTSFTAVSGLSSISLMAFGKPASGHTNPALFLEGGAGGLSGILRSDDDGATWKKISDPAHPINDSPEVMGADRQTFGRVYIGTNGRGIYVGDSN